MNVKELATLLEARILTEDAGLDNIVRSGYACDLLSWVMANGEEGMAWITVQTHLNVIAVASLAEMACVILPEGVEMNIECIEKSKSENLSVLATKLNAFQAASRMAHAGIQ